MLPLTIVGLAVVAHNRQAAAIAEIERLGGRVVSSQSGPDWLRRLVGDEAMRAFDRATLVNLSETAVEDHDLMILRRLRGIERLNLRGTAIADSGLAHLASLERLRALDLGETRITDAGLVHLSGLSELEYLYLSGTRVTDAGLVHLKGLTHLRHLALDGTGVTPAGVATLRASLPSVNLER